MVTATLVVIGLLFALGFCLRSESVDFKHIDTYIFFTAVFCFSAASGENIEYLLGISERYLEQDAVMVGILGGGLTFIFFLIRHVPNKTTKNSFFS